MFCKKCGKRIPDDAPVCENCGTEISSDKIEEITETAEKNLSVNQDEELIEEKESYPACETSEEAIGNGVQKNEDGCSNKAESEEKIVSEKKKIGKKAIIIGAAALVLCVVLIIVSFPYMKNTFMKLFMSPENYFSYVIKNNSTDTAKSISNTLDDLKNSTLNAASSTGNFKMKVEKPFHDIVYDVTGDVELGGQFSKLFEMAGISVGSMVEWMDEISADYNIKSDGKNMQSELDVNINDEKFGKIDIVNEKKNKTTYIGFPDYNDFYFSLNSNDNFGNYSAIMDSAEKVITALPEKELTEKIIMKYIECFADNVGDVKKTGKTVHAGEFSKKITSLSAQIDKSEMEAITKKLLDELKNDKDIKEIIKKAAASIGKNEKDLIQSVENALKEFNRFYSDDLNGKVTFEIYVDGKGKIIGTNVSNDKFGYSNCTITKWFELSNEINGKFGIFNFNLNGKGKLSDNKVNFDYKLEIMGSKMATVKIYDLDYKKFKEGIYDAKATVTFDESVSKVASMVFNSKTENSPAVKLVKILPDLILKIDLLQKSDEETDVNMTVTHKNKLCATVDINNKSGEKKDVTLPEKHMNVKTKNLITEWTKTFDNNKFFEFMEKAGAPKVGILKLGYNLFF